MAIFFKAIYFSMHRDETDLNATRILKFCSAFIASFGESSETHPIVLSSFDELLNVRYEISII
jgi:hypothetical protein